MADTTAAEEAVREVIRKHERAVAAMEAMEQSRQAIYEKERKEARRLPANLRLHEHYKGQNTRIH